MTSACDNTAVLRRIGDLRHALERRAVPLVGPWRPLWVVWLLPWASRAILTDHPGVTGPVVTRLAPFL